MLFQFSDKLPEELVDVYENSTLPICLDAYEIATGDAEDVFVELCEAIQDSEIENIDDEYQAWFDELAPLCDDLLDELEEEDGVVERKKVSYSSNNSHYF